MISEQHKILVHRAIDGELSAAELSDFNQLLESSEEFRQFHAQLQALASLPTHLPSVDAPAGLKGQIRANIDKPHGRSRSFASNPRSIGALFGTLLTPRLAYGLAAGLIIGIGLGAVTFSGNSSQLNPLDLSGTLISGKDSMELVRVDADTFGDDHIEGRLAVDAGSGLTYIQIELHSQLDATVILEFDQAAYTLRAFEQQSPVSGRVSTGPGQLTASHLGQNLYLFVLGTTGDSQRPVVCRVESNGVVYRRELHL